MSVTKKISNGVKCLAIALGALFLLTSCKALGKEGLVLMTDDSYKATVFATNKIGFGSPDGILWNKGKLYLADEGGVALEVWSENDGLRKLMDGQFGTQSPEDLVIDAQGNVFFSDDDAGGVWEVDATGKPRLLAGKEKGLTSTEGIALAPDGSILVGDADQHEVFKVTRDGAVSVFIGKEFGITKPESMVFDEKGCPVHLYPGHEADYPPSNISREFQALTAACWLVTVTSSDVDATSIGPLIVIVWFGVTSTSVSVFVLKPVSANFTL